MYADVHFALGVHCHILICARLERGHHPGPSPSHENGCSLDTSHHAWVPEQYKKAWRGEVTRELHVLVTGEYSSLVTQAARGTRCQLASVLFLCDGSTVE